MEIKLVNIDNKTLKGLSLSIKGNGVYSVIGTGKSSLFNLIYGIDLDFAGEIYIGRKKINNKSKLNEIYSIRKNISYLMQEYSDQLFNINILEDIKYGLNKFDYNKFYELLKYFGLDDKILKKNYNDLSDGEKKKILLIKTFMSDSKIIILDDVTSALDSKSIDKLIKYLKKEKRNRMILITSFDSDFLLSVSDNIIILDDGIIYSDKYFAFSNEILLNKVGMNMPSVLKFRQIVLNKKNIKLIYRDNINDLIKDIYRNV